jgi:hypothetical protein
VFGLATLVAPVMLGADPSQDTEQPGVKAAPFPPEPVYSRDGARQSLVDQVFAIGAVGV